MLRTLYLSIAFSLVFLPGLIQGARASKTQSQQALSAGLFTAPVAGPIRYSRVPVDSGTAFDPNDPRTWYTMVWAGRYSGPAAQRAEGSGGHPGVDIRDRYGEMTGDLGVYAIADGIVIRRRMASGWGNFVAIRHDDVGGLGTIYSVYAHLDSFDPSIASGQEGHIRVARGRRIGTMGSTGLDNPAARHLHFQIDKTWPEDKNAPFWPTYTDNGNAVPYPAGNDAQLTQSQLREAAAAVKANTLNPMLLVETGSANGQNKPQVSVEPDCGAPGTLFTLQWTGFTPNSTLTSHLRKPDGTEFPILQFNTDGQGNATFIIDSSEFVPGTYQHFAVDDVTGAQSNVVSILVRPLSEGMRAITFGQNVGLSRDTERFEFCANVFDVLSIWSPYNDLLLFDPTGEPVATDNGWLYVPLLRSGNYTLQVEGGGVSEFVNVQRVNRPALARPIRCGQSLLMILNGRQRHTFIFHGSPGQQITLTVNGDLRVAEIELYDPSGNPLAIEWPDSASFRISEITLLEEGIYTILVNSDWLSRSIQYTISVSCQ